VRQEIQAFTRASITFGTPHHQLNTMFNAFNGDLSYIELHREQTPLTEPEMQISKHLQNQTMYSTPCLGRILTAFYPLVVIKCMHVPGTYSFLLGRPLGFDFGFGCSTGGFGGFSLCCRQQCIVQRFDRGQHISSDDLPALVSWAAPRSVLQ
jgi:hypothetical protein